MADGHRSGPRRAGIAHSDRVEAGFPLQHQCGRYAERDGEFRPRLADGARGVHTAVAVMIVAPIRVVGLAANLVAVAPHQRANLSGGEERIDREDQRPDARGQRRGGGGAAKLEVVIRTRIVAGTARSIRGRDAVESAVAGGNEIERAAGLAVVRAEIKVGARADRDGVGITGGITDGSFEDGHAKIVGEDIGQIDDKLEGVETHKFSTLYARFSLRPNPEGEAPDGDVRGEVQPRQLVVADVARAERVRAGSIPTRHGAIPVHAARHLGPSESTTPAGDPARRQTIALEVIDAAIGKDDVVQPDRVRARAESIGCILREFPAQGVFAFLIKIHIHWTPGSRTVAGSAEDGHAAPAVAPRGNVRERGVDGGTDGEGEADVDDIRAAPG